MRKRILLISLLSLLSIATVLVIYYVKSNTSIAYVDNSKLFADFKMTKELKNTVEKELQFKNSQLDSLQLLLKLTSDQDLRSSIMQRLITQQQAIEDYQKNFIDSNSAKIWSRIEAYSKDFARKNDYDIIIGSQYKGDILYGEDKLNVTVQLLDFINKKYDGL